MSLPYSSIVSITGVVENPAFTTEKKHMILATTNPLITTSNGYLTYSGASALSDYASDFGRADKEYTALQKYFAFVSKEGNAPEKAIIARWYNADTSAFLKGAKVSTAVSALTAYGNGGFTVRIDNTDIEVSFDLTGATSYSSVASIIQTALQTSVESATVAYSSVTGGFIITSGTTGKMSYMGYATAPTAEGVTDLSSILGLSETSGAELSEGADKETFAEFCDRVMNANVGGYSITTLEELTNDEIIEASAWLQTTLNSQSYNTACRLVFDFTGTDTSTAKAVSATLQEMGYTGTVLIYDPYDENVNILDCAICATIDYDVDNGAINFNFQPATGYTAVTSLGSVIDYQQGQTNSALMDDLNNNYLSCVYSVGFGSQEQTYYGFGLMTGAFGTESIQVDESALEQAIQVSVLNGLSSLNKIPLRGDDANDLVGALLNAPLNKFVKNGVIAVNGTLSTVERASVSQATGNANAADALEQTGYFYKIQDLTEEDISLQRVRVLICYLASGVVNRLRIINRIYGA